MLFFILKTSNEKILNESTAKSHSEYNKPLAGIYLRRVKFVGKPGNGRNWKSFINALFKRNYLSKIFLNYTKNDAPNPHLL